MARLPANYSVNIGDNVSVIYALWVNGSLYDTNNVTLANESGIYKLTKSYKPLNFTVEFNKGMIDGFVINVIGMRVNETVTFNVDPERGYGLYDPSKVMVLPRYYNKTMNETIPRSYFTERGMNVSNGTSYRTQYGTVFIQDFNDENVTIFYFLQEGSKFTVNGIPQKVVSTIFEKTKQYATIEFMLDVNKTYVLPDPVTGQKKVFKVIDKTDQNITLDSNHALANQTLRFRVTLLDVTPARLQ
jgi:FKBP-type peptidyl-prolyl cis-trans isomerase 2